MSQPIPPHVMDRAVADYQAGASLRQSAGTHGMSIGALRKALARRNIPTRTRGWNLATLERGPESLDVGAQRAKEGNTAPDTREVDTAPFANVRSLRERIAEARRQDRRAA